MPHFYRVCGVIAANAINTAYWKFFTVTGWYGDGFRWGNDKVAHDARLLIGLIDPYITFFIRSIRQLISLKIDNSWINLEIDQPI